MNTDIENLIVLERLALYNRELPCGAKAIRTRIAELLPNRPLPTLSTINRLLAHHGLTHGRTGHYPGDEPCWIRPSPDNGVGR